MGLCPRTPEVYPPQDTRWSNVKMKDSEVLKLRCPPPFYPQLASRSLLSVALLGCLPSLDAAVCVMRLHGLFFGTVPTDIIPLHRHETIIALFLSVANIQKLFPVRAGIAV